ncbi:MAG: YrzE family protein [Clostridia bacterium]|nr:YrzE family protein [Clostridia bacterium]
MENNKKRNPSANQQNLFICALIGGGISFAVMTLTVLLFPFVALKLGDPNAIAIPISYMCAFIGALVGGFVSAKKCGDFMIQVGLMSSGVTILPMVLISFLIPGSGNIISALIIIAIIVCASMLGAYSVMKINGSRKRNMKKVMKRRG